MKRKALIIVLIAVLALTGCSQRSSFIGEERAKEIALEHAQAKKDDIRRLSVRKDAEGTKTVYEVELSLNGGREYDYDIDALTGEILSFDFDEERGLVETMQSALGNNDNKAQELTEEEAKGIALAKVPGATEENIRKFRKEYDDGREKYEGEIYYNKTEYDFEIDAKSGTILQWEAD